jgi:UDP-N-acetylmuramate--alanine ligase
LFLAQEKVVSGSDTTATDITKELARRGVAMTYSQTNGVPKGTDMVIYSEAVPFESPERADARANAIPEMSYAEALGAISKDKRTIAVSGTNGKSTTTAMLGLILEAAGFDPTVVIGSRVPSFALGNLRIGEGEWMVVEADDYHAHMLQLRPEIIVLTNIEEEHLDYFKDLAHIIRTFQSFVDSLPEDGTLIMNADDPVSFEDLTPHANTVTYGIDAPADYVARDLITRRGQQTFTFARGGADEPIAEIALNVPGRFNAMNALAAATCALHLGVSPEVIRDVLAEFTGIWRRFERVGTCNGADIFSDYGHHPTSIRGTIAAAREFYPGRRLVLVYQPHQRNRTRQLLADFAGAFDGVDLLLLSDIYDVAGREDAADEGVTSALIVDEMKKRSSSPTVALAGDLVQTEQAVRGAAKDGDVVIIMGAGDIDSVARNLAQS